MKSRSGRSDKAIELIGKVAKLEFRLPDGTVVLDGSELKDAREEKDPSTGQVYVALEFKESGAKKFADVTTQLVKVPGKRRGAAGTAVYRHLPR